jgi:hypothetical protein
MTNVVAWHGMNLIPSSWKKPTSVPYASPSLLELSCSISCKPSDLNNCFETTDDRVETLAEAIKATALPSSRLRVATHP